MVKTGDGRIAFRQSLTEFSNLIPTSSSRIVFWGKEKNIQLLRTAQVFLG
jgi:hypothetical protein